MTTKQGDEESLHDYTTRFRQVYNDVKQVLGTDFLSKFVMNTEEFTQCGGDTIKEGEVINNSYDKWTTFIYLDNCDKNKYGSLIRGFKTQYALGNNQYPDTIKKGYDVMCNHKWDESYDKYLKNKKNNKTTRRTEKKADEDTNKEKNGKEESGTQMMQKEVICYCCGEKGHFSDDCPKKDEIPKSEWAVKKGMSMFIESKNDDEKNSVDQNDDEEEPDVDWMGEQFLQLEVEEDRGTQEWSDDEFTGVEKIDNDVEFKLINNLIKSKMECTGVARKDDETMTGMGIYDVREQKRTYVVYEKGKAKKLVECLRTNGTT